MMQFGKDFSQAFTCTHDYINDLMNFYFGTTICELLLEIIRISNFNFSLELPFHIHDSIDSLIISLKDFCIVIRK